MMSDLFHDIIRQHSAPLQPLPTQMDPHLPAQKGLRAVLLDVYGTMFVSASGEVGTTAEQGQQKALAAALEAVGLAGLVEAGDEPVVVNAQVMAVVSPRVEVANDGCGYGYRPRQGLRSQK